MIPISWFERWYWLSVLRSIHCVIRFHLSNMDFTFIKFLNFPLTRSNLEYFNAWICLWKKINLSVFFLRTHFMEEYIHILDRSWQIKSIQTCSFLIRWQTSLIDHRVSVWDIYHEWGAALKIVILFIQQIFEWLLRARHYFQVRWFFSE